MDVDDLQKLYSELRGSRCAPAVMDARGHFLERRMQESLRALSEAQAKYRESRQRILKQTGDEIDSKAKDADRQLKRLKRKQEKAKEILATFEDLIGQLEKMAQREKTREAEKQKKDAAAKVELLRKKQAEPAKSDSSPAAESGAAATVAAEPPRAGALTTANLSGEFLHEFDTLTGDRQLAAVSAYCNFRAIESIDDVVDGGVYLMFDGDHGHLFVATAAEQDPGTMECTDPTSGESIGPVTGEMLVEFSSQRKLVLLTPKDSEGIVDDARDRVLDMGAFSQLMDSAQRSGLVPGADQIAHVRDKEFRKGKYDLALQAIENLFGKFTSAATTRSQRLMREDADIASGKIKMSPKDLQAKRARDRADEQNIERARLRFSRVLNGLRVLMKNE